MNKTNTIKIGLIQMKMLPDPRTNLVKASKQIVLAAAKGAQVIVLPELFGCRYFPQYEDQSFFKLAEPIPGPTTSHFSEISAAKKVVLIVPLFEKTRNGVYHNSVAVIDSGSILGVYRKMHIPYDPYFYEKYYFAPGDSGFPVFETRYGKISVLICWDQWFPEAARLSALAGAQILIYPTAIGWDRTRRDKEQKKELAAWETIQRAHAIANSVFVAAVNRVGIEEKLVFWGNSFVSDPFGGKIVVGTSSKEQILIASCDLLQIHETRKAWPFMRDRRVDAYSSLTSEFVGADEK